MSIFDRSTPATILCCLCGAPIAPNPSSMCVNCIQTQVDITDGIPKQLTIQWCKGCERYFQPPNAWIIADLESRQLLAICLKRIRGMNKVKLIDASFIWTEPHSKRLKVKLTIQKEVFNSTILQQSFVIEYVVQNLFCPDCQRAEAKLTWRAVAQVRQKIDHKRTFYWLEQLILKHNAQTACVSISEKPDGLDFFFDIKNKAYKFVEFIGQFVPLKMKESKELISADIHTSTYNYKYTLSVEIAPVCREDLICFPSPLARSNGNISPLVLCHKVSDSLHFMDPLTLKTATISAQMFWRTPFRGIAGRAQLTMYIIMDVILLGPTLGKYALAEVHLARERDLGHNDTQFITNSHLGNILKPGDYALGYDLTSMNFNCKVDSNLKALKGKQVPEVILCKKAYVDFRAKKKRRKWRVKQMDVEADESLRKADLEKAERDRAQFLDDLEEDPELWKQVNLYKEDDASSTISESDNEEFPGPKLSDLIDKMDDMTLEDMDVE